MNEFVIVSVVAVIMALMLINSEMKKLKRTIAETKVDIRANNAKIKKLEDRVESIEGSMQVLRYQGIFGDQRIRDVGNISTRPRSIDPHRTTGIQEDRNSVIFRTPMWDDHSPTTVTNHTTGYRGDTSSSDSSSSSSDSGSSSSGSSSSSSD